MTAAQMLAMGGFPDTPQGRQDFYSQYPSEEAFMAKFGKQMKMGGLTNEVGFPQQPTENKFYSEGFRPSVSFGFYETGGLTNQVAFPQQPTADHFYNSGWKPSTPFGFYEQGGLTNEIAFPQQPVDAWIHAHTPYKPSYANGGKTKKRLSKNEIKKGLSKAAQEINAHMMAGSPTDQFDEFSTNLGNEQGRRAFEQYKVPMPYDEQMGDYKDPYLYTQLVNALAQDQIVPFTTQQRPITAAPVGLNPYWQSLPTIYNPWEYESATLPTPNIGPDLRSVQPGEQDDFFSEYYKMGGLPGGANNMPCMECGGYMQDGGTSTGSQYGGYVGMDAPLTMRDGGASNPNPTKQDSYWVDLPLGMSVANVFDKRFWNDEYTRMTNGNIFGDIIRHPYEPFTTEQRVKQINSKKLSKKAKGGKVDGLTQDQYVSDLANTFLDKVKNNAAPFIEQEARDEFFGNQTGNQSQFDQYAQYGISTGYSNPYSGSNDTFSQPYNLQTLANQKALQNEIDAYDKQSSEASSNMFDATSNLASELFMAKGGALNKYQYAGGTGGGSAVGTSNAAVNPSTGLPINTSSNTSQSNTSGLSNDDLLRQYFNEYLDKRFGTSSQEALGYNPYYGYSNQGYPTMGGNNYLKFKVKGDKDLRRNAADLMSKYNFGNTELRDVEVQNRSGLARFLGMKDPRKITYHFRSKLTPQPFTDFRLHPTSSPGTTTPVANTPSIMRVSGTNMVVNPGSQVRASDIIADNANINVGQNAQMKTYDFGGLMKAQVGIDTSSPIYKPYKFTDISGAAPSFNANKFDPNKVSLGKNNNMESYGKEKQKQALTTQGLNALKTDKTQDFKVEVKKKKDIDTAVVGDFALAGMDYLTSMFNEDERKAAKDKLQQSTMADNMFAAVPANAVSKGDYGVLPGQQLGKLKPNEYGPVYEPGVLSNYGAYGGSFEEGGTYNEGDEVELTDEEIAEIIANGGSVEYLD